MNRTDLAALLPVDSADLNRLRSLLATAAAAADILDIAYRTVESPLGPLLVAATRVGLVRVAFTSEGHDSVLQSLAVHISPRVLEAPDRLDEVSRQFGDYFEGRRHSFALALDWQLTAGFQRTVLEHLAVDVGYGDTATYSALAQLAGSPRAARAVGSACAANPIPVVVPCHRVVRADGAIGGYRGGPAAKQVLLDLEGGA